MNLPNLVQAIKVELKKELPGKIVQFEMAPSDRSHKYFYQNNNTTPQKAGVLILLFPCNGDLCTVFIQRTIYPGPHSGQISFPGGKFDQKDGELCRTAIRETSEELGISSETIKIIGDLSPLVISVSNFHVYPFVGYMDKITKFIIQPDEVQHTITENITILQKPDVLGRIKFFRKGITVFAPCYNIQGRKVWGATAMILREFLEIVRRVEINSAR